jgi:hypothetical protein
VSTLVRSAAYSLKDAYAYRGTIDVMEENNPEVHQEIPPAEAPASAPQAMDVVAPPPVEASDEKTSADQPTDTKPSESTDKQPEKPAAPDHPAPPKPAKSGVTGAIVATVIVVLGLAALATYAYLQTK